MKTPNFFSVIIIIILGYALYDKFDFENMKFEKPAIAIVYIIAILISIYLLMKDLKKIRVI
ncbi:hypothetical protein ACFQ5N_08395 [Lutibacter holmesii]|uniref:ATP synthase F0 sector subunit C n=1 Tax=Lutibacter holmesii TaxID=1137985 RepID=A0ABW3WQB8_9FLAO